MITPLTLNNVKNHFHAHDKLTIFTLNCLYRPLKCNGPKAASLLSGNVGPAATYFCRKKSSTLYFSFILIMLLSYYYCCVK